MKNILLVEDDPFLVDIYANQFKKDGFLVEIAIDGQMALDKIKNHYPDVLVLDIMLPKINGWELLKAIRSNGATKNIKVVIISNLNKKDNQENIAKWGVSHYFLKVETTPEEVSSKIKEMLN